MSGGRKCGLSKHIQYCNFYGNLFSKYKLQRAQNVYINKDLKSWEALIYNVVKALGGNEIVKESRWNERTD